MTADDRERLLALADEWEREDDLATTWRPEDGYLYARELRALVADMEAGDGQ